MSAHIDALATATGTPRAAQSRRCADVGPNADCADLAIVPIRRLDRLLGKGNSHEDVVTIWRVDLTLRSLILQVGDVHGSAANAEVAVGRGLPSVVTWSRRS
jgi:hypothetical protein